MPVRLAGYLDRLALQLRAAGHVLLFSDFDGTLVPLRLQPSECRLNPFLADTLVAMAQTDRVGVAIISGRSLSDLRMRIAELPGVGLAGNHGLEIEWRGRTFREPAAVRIASELSEIVAGISTALKHVPGAWIEDKGLTASVHHRQVQHAMLGRLHEATERALTTSRGRSDWVLRYGNEVIEIRPRVKWHKGSAARWLMEQMVPVGQDVLLIYLGDDLTDEDVFREFPEAITVRVGAGGSTVANFFLEDSAEAQASLEWLAGELSRRDVP